jgi:hypothetical protein
MGVETTLRASRRAATSAMTDDSRCTFSLPSVSRKKVTAAFDGSPLIHSQISVNPPRVPKIRKTAEVYELKSLTFSFAAGPRIVVIEIIRFFVWGRAPWGHRASVKRSRPIERFAMPGGKAANRSTSAAEAFSKKLRALSVEAMHDCNTSTPEVSRVSISRRETTTITGSNIRQSLSCSRTSCLCKRS